ncbi:MAG: extracellular solute-binding protein [Defluviitaleaceae bacterium]|nr:extracellular solute-binding protein [Defluviitaleaceae bacterium]
MKKLLLSALVLSMLLSIFPAAPLRAAAVDAGQAPPRAGSQISDFDLFRSQEGYALYMATHDFTMRPQVEIPINLQAVTQDDAAEITFTDEALYWTNDRGVLYWHFTVAEAGVYQIELDYRSIGTSGTPIERDLLINGRIPFTEARALVLPLFWVRSHPNIRQDNQGNDIRPAHREEQRMLTARLEAHSGFFTDPLGIFLEAGEHTIGFGGVREPMAIYGLRLVPFKELPTHAQVAAARGSVPHATGEIMIRGIDATAISDQTLHPHSDFRNSYTLPFELGARRLNFIGGFNWRNVGQWIEWEFYAPEAGLYQMMMRTRQNALLGIPVAREISINGQIPFAEAAHVVIPYSTRWQITTPQINDDEPMLFYLQQGYNTIRMRNILGDFGEVMRNVQEASMALSSLYSRIIMVTGVVPDPFRDYLLTNRIVGLVDTLEETAALLREQIATLEAMAGGSVPEAHTLNLMAVQLDSLAADPESIPQRLGNFKDNIDMVGAWVMRVTQQPVDINYIMFAPAGTPAPRANPGFFTRMWTAIRSFFLTFTMDFTSIGDVFEEGEAISVWVAMGNEWATSLKTLIDNEFTPRTGIPVNLNIITEADALLFSVASGRPPDVAIGGMPLVDFGLRGAMVDLTQFPDFDEVAKRFLPVHFDGLGYGSEIFGLPDMQSMPVMLYRRDILDEIGIEPPDVWDDLHRIIPLLQERNLTVAMGATYDLFLIQNGGWFFNENNTRVAIDSPAGIDAFTRFTQWYTHYGLPEFFDLYNRFRTGEMPIAITDFSFINMLYVAAPEIRGRWGIQVIPGTVREDGSIDRTVLAGSGGIGMFNASERQEDAWEFLKWFTEADTQIAFGRTLQAILGDGARYNSANLEAMRGMGWPTEVIHVLEESWENAVVRPFVPGAYYMDRHLMNARREVISLGELPRQALLRYVDRINAEITRKRAELGLEVYQP